MVGKAWDKPRRKLCTKGEREAVSDEPDFLVNNMELSKVGVSRFNSGDSDERRLVVLLDVLGQLVAAAALDRGLIDAAEFNNASSDRVLGFPDVVKNCMLQSFHQSGEQFEILFNKGKLDALPAELKAIIEHSVQAASADMSWKAIQRNSQDYIELKAAKINFYKTPDAILRAQLAAWDKVLAAQSEDPFFAKVVQSQKAWAKRVVGAQFELEVDQKLAYEPGSTDSRTSERMCSRSSVIWSRRLA